MSTEKVTDYEIKGKWIRLGSRILPIERISEITAHSWTSSLVNPNGGEKAYQIKIFCDDRRVYLIESDEKPKIEEAFNTIFEGLARS